VSILPNVPFKFEITPEKYSALKSFICIGRIVPNDRVGLSAQWDLRVKVISEDYIEKPTFDPDDRWYPSPDFSVVNENVNYRLDDINI
jgi:hypothetical protein